MAGSARQAPVPKSAMTAGYKTGGAAQPPWYHADVYSPREAAQLMKGKEEGFFIIAPDSNPRVYRLFFRAGGRTEARRIIRSRDATYQLETSTERFPHLSDLVRFYSGPAAVGADLPIALGSNHHRIGVSSRGVSYRHDDAASPTVVDPGLTGDAAIVSRWDAEDVGIWLVAMGLSRFQARLRFISGIHLLTIDASAVTALGIVDEDDRAELLAAIGSLRASGSARPVLPGTMVRGMAEHPPGWDPLTNAWSKPNHRPTGGRRHRFAVQQRAGVVRIIDLTTREVAHVFSAKYSRYIMRMGLQSDAAKAVVARSLTKLHYDPELARNIENTRLSGIAVGEPPMPHVEAEEELDPDSTDEAEGEGGPPRGSFKGNWIPGPALEVEPSVSRHVHHHYHHQIGGGGGGGDSANVAGAVEPAETAKPAEPAEPALSHDRQKQMAAWIRQHRYGEDQSPEDLFDRMFQNSGAVTPARTKSPMVNGQHAAAAGRRGGGSGPASSAQFRPPVRQHPRGLDVRPTEAFRVHTAGLDGLWPEAAIPQGGMGGAAAADSPEPGWAEGRSSSRGLDLQDDFPDHTRATPATSGLKDEYFENLDPMGEANMTQYSPHKQRGSTTPTGGSFGQSVDFPPPSPRATSRPAGAYKAAGQSTATPVIGNVHANPAFADHLSPEYYTPIRLRGQSMSPASMPDAEYLPMSTRAHIDPKIHLAGAQNGEYLLQPNQLSAVLDGQVYTKALETDGGSLPFWLAGSTRRFIDIQSLIEYYRSPGHLSDAATDRRNPDLPVALATVRLGAV